jgi:hypothetical protein
LPREDHRPIDAREAAEEGLFLGLRRSRGLRSSRHLAAFQASVVGPWKEWGRAANALTTRPGRVRPTDRGLFLAQDLAAELLARGDASSSVR